MVARGKLADQKQMFEDMHRITPFFPIFATARRSRPTVALTRRRESNRQLEIENNLSTGILILWSNADKTDGRAGMPVLLQPGAVGNIFSKGSEHGLIAFAHRRSQQHAL